MSKNNHENNQQIYSRDIIARSLVDRQLSKVCATTEISYPTLLRLQKNDPKDLVDWSPTVYTMRTLSAYIKDTHVALPPQDG